MRVSGACWLASRSCEARKTATTAAFIVNRCQEQKISTRETAWCCSTTCQKKAYADTGSPGKREGIPPTTRTGWIDGGGMTQGSVGVHPASYRLRNSER